MLKKERKVGIEKRTLEENKVGRRPHMRLRESLMDGELKRSRRGVVAEHANVRGRIQSGRSETTRKQKGAMHVMTNKRPQRDVGHDRGVMGSTMKEERPTHDETNKKKDNDELDGQLDGSFRRTGRRR